MCFIERRIKFPDLSRSTYNSFIVIQKAVPQWGLMLRGLASHPYPQRAGQIHFLPDLTAGILAGKPWLQKATCMVKTI